MPKINLAESYKNSQRIIATAHRGFSGKYPENTLQAFEEAIQLGVDLVEFDLRATRDQVPIVLHDKTLDRTANTSGQPENYDLTELREMNCSYWQGAHNNGKKLLSPAVPKATIPTFEEVINSVKNKTGLNIQVYTNNETVLTEICRLYDAYDLYQDGYLTMSDFAAAEVIKKINPNIEICVLAERDNLSMHKSFGSRFIQPPWSVVTPEFCNRAKELDLHINMFFSNTDKDNRKFIDYGVRGILTDYPDILLKTIKDMGLNQ